MKLWWNINPSIANYYPIIISIWFALRIETKRMLIKGFEIRAIHIPFWQSSLPPCLLIHFLCTVFHFDFGMRVETHDETVYCLFILNMYGIFCTLNGALLVGNLPYFGQNFTHCDFGDCLQERKWGKLYIHGNWYVIHKIPAFRQYNISRDNLLLLVLDQNPSAVNQLL